MKRKFSVSASSRSMRRRDITASSRYRYAIGDFVEYDGNARGVYPRMGQGRIIQVEPGLAGRGDPNPDPIYTIEKSDGRRVKLGEFAIKRIITNSSKLRNRRTITASRAYESPRYKHMVDIYMPDRGEGTTMAQQLATAVNRLIYKWYNDGDVYDNHYGMDGFANDISDCANWLYENIPASRNILDGIYDCVNDAMYERILSLLVTRCCDDEDLSRLDEVPAVGSIYDCNGPFSFEDFDDDEEDW